jgi:hypothetical protein
LIFRKKLKKKPQAVLNFNFWNGGLNGHAAGTARNSPVMPHFEDVTVTIPVSG